MRYKQYCGLRDETLVIKVDENCHDFFFIFNVAKNYYVINCPTPHQRWMQVKTLASDLLTTRSLEAFLSSSSS